MEYLTRSARVTSRRYQAMFLLAGVLYPAWWFILTSTNSSANDSLIIRGIFGFAFLSIFISSLKNEKMRARLPQIFVVSAWILTAHFSYLTSINHSHPIYVIALFLLIFLVGICFESAKGLVSYLAFSLALSLFIDDSDSVISTWFVEATIFTAAAVAYVAFADKLELLNFLRKANQSLFEKNQTLQNTENALKEAQSLAKIGNYEINYESNTRWWSPQAARNFGVSESTQYSDAQVNKLIHPEDFPSVAESWDRAIQTKMYFEHQYRIIRPSGQLAYINGVGKPILNDAGEIKKMIGTLHDVTDRVKMEEAFRVQQAHLANIEKMSTLGQMAGGIAHEIGSPLSVILIHIDKIQTLSKKGQLTNEDVAKHVDKINSTIKRISKIVTGLKNFSRNGEADNFESASIDQIILETLEMCETRLRHASVKVNFEPNSGLMCECRSVQISQVLTNLLNNACDAMAEIENPNVYIQVKDLGKSLEIRVQNSGTVISQEICDKIFEPFFTTKGIGKGTGLGLSISKGIMESHDGNLFVDTSASMTTFVIQMPKTHIEQQNLRGAA